jgi:altronate dehydratase
MGDWGLCGKGWSIDCRHSMSSQFSFAQVGRVPAPGDNAAVAVCRLESGTKLLLSEQEMALPFTVLEGHRFALKPIAAGEALLSWGLPFGHALREIVPGEYLCNEKILAALRQRHVDFALPDSPNFADHFAPYSLTEKAAHCGEQVFPADEPLIFEGYLRPGNRGVGTRNYIAIIGTSALTASFARALAGRLQGAAEPFPNVDGIVAVAHTEGGGPGIPNNLELVLRTLAGYMVHSNLGAVLAVDLGSEPVNNEALRRYMGENNYPLDHVPHRFLSLRGNFAAGLAEGESAIREWLAPVNRCARSMQPLAQLKVALQCGGSDAFSGISGNPLAGLVAREIIRQGGCANLAETDELIGAEPYILNNVRDMETARTFVETLKRFQERAQWHGASAEGNPSGGNLFRGLYNIVVKSIGAGRKKSPDVRLDYVIEYSRRMLQPGFYFMDSPGNDLESIAGQAASGCNLILFTTGNGSITNFPFVPTIKIMTNSPRFRMLSREMDVNAGRYLDGESLDALGQETLELAVKIASGQRSAGERAGHSQAQLWREWRQTGPKSAMGQDRSSRYFAGHPLALHVAKMEEIAAKNSARLGAPLHPHPSRRRVGLILPTSLCSGQVARMASERVNAWLRAHPDEGAGLERTLALVHTEGCAVSGGDAEELYLRTLAGYLKHPLIQRALLLEHGCERTHNDAFRNFLEAQKMDPERFGWASVQMDGGIENALKKIETWFQSGRKSAVTTEAGEEGPFRLGLLAWGSLPENAAQALARVARAVAGWGGSVVVPEQDAFLEGAFWKELMGKDENEQGRGPTLGYGQPIRKEGFHVMETPTAQPVEILTGIGGTGVDLIVAMVSGSALPSHPLVPVLQIGVGREVKQAEDLDGAVEADRDVGEVASDLMGWIREVVEGGKKPKLFAQGNVDFQVTRGRFGVSL